MSVRQSLDFQPGGVHTVQLILSAELVSGSLPSSDCLLVGLLALPPILRGYEMALS